MFTYLIINFSRNIRIFFFGLDWIFYNLIPLVYDFIITISKTSIMSQGQIKDIGGRIQALLGVFMLFKVSFSIITYIINPDEFSDKSKGFAKLWQNAIISLILLILTPYIFGMAYDLQAKLLEDNSLMYLVFGDKNKIDSNFKSNAGQEIAFSVMIPFFLPHTAVTADLNHDISACKNVLNSDGTFNEECKAAIEDEVSDNHNEEFDATVIENYTKGIELRNLGLTFRTDTALFVKKDNVNFVINYRYLVSTAVAVIVLLILITFCMDVALRSVKLAFLQLIAPIPIISYIDPKQGKDGMFKKWYKMCFSTYLSLFIRLLALYLGIYMIGIVVSTGATDIVTGESVDNFWVKLIMIIGILMFVKQLPKILEGLGIKLDGGGKFHLNPFKKFEEEAFGGKQILGAGAAMGAGILAGTTNFASRITDPNRSWRNENGRLSLRKAAGNVTRALSSAYAGQTSAIFRGTRKMMKGEKAGKIFADSYGEAMFAKLIRQDNLRKAGLEDSSLGERIRFGAGAFGADVARYMGVLNRGQQEYLLADEQDKQISKLQNDNAELKVAQEKLRQDKFSAFEEIQGIGKNIDTLLENNSAVKTAKTAWENAKARGDSDEVIEKLRQAYKLKKAEILKDENAKVDSAIHNQVELYNQLRNKAISDGKITTAQASKFANLSTDIKFKADTNGSFVTVGTDYYEIRTDVHGVEYYIDSSGSRIYKSDWSSMGAVRSKVDKSGVSIIGDNDDMVTAEKITFETSADYKAYSDRIKENEQSIDTIKASTEYIQAHDENSIYKLENASRFNKQVQQPGYKPAAGPAQGTPFRGMYNPPMGGTPPRGRGGSGGTGTP